MLSPADRALVAADPVLPGLAVLLDDAAAAGWLRGAGCPVVSVRRRYLRYKPATSCVVEASVVTPDGPLACFLAAHSATGADKVAKAVAKAPPGAVLAVDAPLGLVAATPAADRDLPALAVLADPRRQRPLLRRLLPDWCGRGGVVLQPLHHKPHRRWVGRLDADGHPPVVLRAYRPGDVARAVAAGRALAVGAPRTPAVLGADLDLAVSTVEYLAGEPLDTALLGGRTGQDDLRAAGAALAALHGSAAVALPPREPAREVDAVRAAARQLATLLPEQADRAVRLADALAARLQAAAATGIAVPLHGDFSADQVVLGPSGPALIDLDAACFGEPALDLASAAAGLALLTETAPALPVVEAACLEALAEGYAARRPFPDADRVAVHTSALLLRRALEPFRLCAAGWPASAGRLLARAEQALTGDGVAA